VLREGAVLEDGARVEDLTLVGPGQRIPAGETWAGSPARRAPDAVRTTPPRPVHGPIRRAATVLLYLALMVILPMSMLGAGVPGLTLLMQLDLVAEPVTFIAMTPVVGALFVAGLALEVVVLKWLLVGRVKAGVYPVHGHFYMRNWVVDQLLKLGLDMLGALHATMWAAPWYRALGARLGRFVEMSTASETTPDLVVIGDGGTIADEVSLGSAKIEGGWMTLAETRVGTRAFAGNSAVVPSGAVLGDGSLIGVLSLAPTRGPDAGAPGTSWLGSPPLRLPRREPSASYPDSRTYEPPRRLRAIRRTIELFRVTLP
jgi:non-ribosomal peptide synthetase-like protein